MGPELEKRAGGTGMRKGMAVMLVEGMILAVLACQAVSTPHAAAQVGGESGFLDPCLFGADPTGVRSSAPALRAAIAAAPRTGATISFGPGTFLFDNTVRIDRPGIRIRGAGNPVTSFRFEPTAGDGIFLDFRMNPDTRILYNCSLERIRIYSTDTARKKIGIRLYDVSAMLIENVTVDAFNGNGSIGLLTQGRDQSTVAKFRSWADIPIAIRDNPNSTIDLDHFHFQDTRLLAMNHLQNANSPYANVEVGGNVNLTNIVFDGTNTWNGGKHGFYWGGGAVRESSLNLHFSNIRWEQNADPAGYFFSIDHYVQNVLMANLSGGSAGNGYYLRHARWVTLQNVLYGGTGVALDADNTVWNLKLGNAFFQAGSKANLRGMDPYIAEGLNPPTAPVASNAFFNSSDYGLRAASLNSVYLQDYKLRLGKGETFAIPFFTFGPPKISILTVGAVGEASSPVEGGTVLVSPQAVVLVAGTPNFNVGSLQGKLTVLRVTATDVRINNRLGFPVDLVLTVHGNLPP
jgi:hypothetical protein